MINVFDFEQQIMKCWGVVDDIKTLNQQYMDVGNMSEDNIANYLLGLETIYEVKFQQLFSMYEELLRQKALE